MIATTPRYNNYHYYFVIVLLLLLQFHIVFTLAWQTTSTFHPKDNNVCFINTSSSHERSSGTCSSRNGGNNRRLYAAGDSSSSGDSLRKATGIRPSLHPMTINALSEALLIRAKRQGIWSNVNENAYPEPLQLALLGGNLATDALAKREELLKDRVNFSTSSGSSLQDEDDNMWEIPTVLEKQVVSGRVIGVVVRLQELEKVLIEKVSAVAWVSKYGEHASFGLLACELPSSGGVCDDTTKNDDDGKLRDRLKMDPLFRMIRSECLLALFIENIEKPQLQNLQVSVVDESKIDFIDSDRLEVLFA